MTKHEFYKKWLEHFTLGISEKDIKKHVTSAGILIWHTFSWELLDKSRFLEGDAAKAAYDKQYKGGTLYIEWFVDDEAHNLTWDLEMADDLDKMVEVYVVAEDFYVFGTWGEINIMLKQLSARLESALISL